MPKIDATKYWTDKPPEPSSGLIKLLAKIDNGWKPSGRLMRLGYHVASEFYNIYIWEYVNIACPTLLSKKETNNEKDSTSYQQKG